MTTDKTEVTAKKPATDKAPTAEKKAAKPVTKPAKKAVTTPKLSVKKPKKEPKEKIVNDCFSMPKTEYLKIAEIKEACLKAGLQVKKGEVIRAGLKALGGMNIAELKHAMVGLGKVKANHSKKS